MKYPEQQSPVDFGIEPCYKFETENPERMFWLLSKAFKLERTISKPDGYKFSTPYGKEKMTFDATWEGVIFNLEIVNRYKMPLRHVEEGDRHWLTRKLNKFSGII